MSDIQTEKDYQHYFMERLEQDNGYLIRDAKNFDRLYALDKELLFKFLNDTQPEKMAALQKVYKDNLETTLINNQKIRKPASHLKTWSGNQRISA